MRVPTVTQIQKIERSRAAICTCIYKVEPYRALVWCNKCKGYQKHSRFVDRKV